MVSFRDLGRLVVSLISGSTAFPIRAVITREVPQEHSHEAILRATNTLLKINNPDNIQDAVFGLLGNTAASAGAGKIMDPDCLQTATADRAFTNAKAAGDVAGMSAALQYRALERNTGQVGLKSVQCVSFKPTNPEIAEITQHQDPASEGAAAINKAIVLRLAKQIAAIGGDPQDALKTGSFKAGNWNDFTAKGDTCDDPNDARGCIISRGLITLDATVEEVNAAVDVEDSGTDCTTIPVTITITVSSESTPTPDPVASATSSPTPGAANPTTSSTTSAAPAATSTAASKTGGSSGGDSSSSGSDNSGSSNSGSSNSGSNSGSTSGGSNSGSTTAGSNLQAFGGSLGGLAAPKVTASGSQFQVEGNNLFNTLLDALVRSCDIQNNQCADASNAAGQSKTYSVSDCYNQRTQCVAQANSIASS